MSPANDQPPKPNSGTELGGVLPVLHTPLTDQEAIDHRTLEHEIDWAFETGADGVVVALVSEILRLGSHERMQLAERVCRSVGARGVTVISVGAESTRAAIEFAHHAERVGASAIMAIAPVATKLGRGPTINYFSQIARSVSIPLVVQDASSYVGGELDLSVYLELLNEFGHDRILFKPEASPLGPNVSRLRGATDGQAVIFEGSGGISLVDCFRRGIAGTMPGTDLLDGIVALWNALKAGDEERTYELSLPIVALASLQLQAGLDGFLAIEKYLMKKRGIFPNCRQIEPTSWQLDNETRDEVDRLFDRLMAVIG